MSLELAGGLMVKFSWVVLVPYLSWLHKRSRIKLDNTISKDEANKLIDLKLAPLEIKLDNQTKGLNDKFDIILKLMQEDKADAKSSNERNRIQRKENTDLLNGISTDVEVIKSELTHLKKEKV